MDSATAYPGDPTRQWMYANLSRPDDPHLIFENAALVADVLEPNPVLAYLYGHVREPKPSQDAWTRRAHVATCAECVLKDFFRHHNPARVSTLFDPDAADEAVRAMSSPRGVLALTFHGGFTTMLKHFFAGRMDGGVIIGIKTTPKFRMLAASDSGAALFAAMRTLNEGHAVYVAPDGPFGKPAGSIELLGANCPVSASTPFLAYETGCDTVFYTLRRKGRLLAPHVTPGPSRGSGETFKAFRTRLMGFYRDRIEECLTGDPDNLALAGKWARKFDEAMGFGAGQTTRLERWDVETV
jgi:hypothetical protein